jgi:hypothetical protein
MLSSYDNELTVIFLAFDFRNFVGIQFVANHVLAKANAGIIVKKSSINKNLNFVYTLRTIKYLVS